MPESSPTSALRPAGLIGAGLLVTALMAAAWYLHGSVFYGRTSSWPLISGAVFGFVLQRSRFCFYCGLREFIEERDARPVLGLLAALAVGALGYAVVLGAWVPFPETTQFPPRAHVGPAGWHLLVGGLTFGIGMALSGSCLSAHFYRLGEGSLLAPVALGGAAGGFILGFNAWEFFYVRALTEAPILWLPRNLGYGGALALQLLVLAALAFGVWRRGIVPSPRPAMERSLRGLARAVWVDRWPHWLGGVLVGLLGTAVYLRSTPLGVTSELGRLARKFGGQAGVVPKNLPGLDEFPGCGTAYITEVLFTPNALFVIGLVAAALAGGLAAGQFQPERPTWPRVGLALVGGVLLGFGSMISIGCSIGTLLSGIQAFAVSGWIFAIALVVGVYGGLKFRRALGQ
ncbi:YeeE/YedE thiosulfate transporter family protein [Oleiharenicola lentus]|uniref:YeeE/YedE thiosulfate transporter family protein n=1 Tax=Oleiharenicola lentus TaxID=2508720 RepID=UPI003F678C8A